MIQAQINIEQDKDLRNYLKDCIRGAVNSIAREEIVQIAKDEIQRKITNHTGDFWREVVSEAVRKVLKQELNEVQKLTFIQPYIEAYLQQNINTFTVEKALNAGIKNYITELTKHITNDSIYSATK